MPSASLEFAIAGFGGPVGPAIHYAFTTASAQRKGVYISAISGSPHISLDPRIGEPDFFLEGDFWMQQSGSAGDGNLFVAERSRATDVVFAHRIVTSREDDTSVEQIIARFTSSDAPSDVRVGANAVVLDDFVVTVNTAGQSGSLIRNATWNGGFFMPDLATVAVSGTAMDFLIPSGSVIVETKNFSVLSGSVSVFSGSIILRGDTSQFIVSGSSVSASLLGNPIASVKTGSVSSESLSPVPIDGTIYVNTSSLNVSIRASGTFFDFDVDTPDLIDGGIY